MKSQYTLTVTTVRTEEEEECRTYGIALTLPDGTGREVPDISDDRRMMEELVHALNEGEVSSIHLDDIIEDLLS